MSINVHFYINNKVRWVYRVSPKNGTAYFPQYVDAITGISVWGNFSWEKLHQDQQFWFSTLFSRAHFGFLHQNPARDNAHWHKVKWSTAHNCGKPKWHSLTPSLIWKGKMCTVVSSNPFNFANAHCYERVFGVKHTFCLTRCALEYKVLN